MSLHTFSHADGLQWDARLKVFKTESSTEKYEGSFEYKNTSDKVIHFTKVKASCGCVVVKAPTKALPGETGIINFKAPIPNAGGVLHKLIRVDTDESDKIEYNLSLKVINTDKAKEPVKTMLKKESKVVESDPETKKTLVDKEFYKTKKQPVVVRKKRVKAYIRPENISPREKILEKLLANQVLRDKAKQATQKECPFVPQAINKGLFYDFQNMRIYTCCEECLIKVKKSPYHAIIKLAEKAQTPFIIGDEVQQDK